VYVACIQSPCHKPVNSNDCNASGRDGWMEEGTGFNVTGASEVTGHPCGVQTSTATLNAVDDHNCILYHNQS